MSAPEEWDRLREVALRHGVGFEPIGTDALNDIRASFIVNTGLQQILDMGYPARPLEILGEELFPTVQSLLAWRREDKAWPAEWFPLTLPTDHFVLYFSSSKADVRGIWNDSDIETDGSYGEGERYYRELAAFIRAVRVCVTHLAPEAFEVRTTGGWLRKKERRYIKAVVAEAIARDFGSADQGPAVLPYLQTSFHDGFDYDESYRDLFHA